MFSSDKVYLINLVKGFVIDMQTFMGPSIYWKFHIKIQIYQNLTKIKISLLIQFLFLEFHRKTTLVKNLECPECQHPVPVTCLGGHETSDWPCAIAKSAPCGRKCGRSLACENHTCDRDCHKVKNAPNDLQSGSNCR